MKLYSLDRWLLLSFVFLLVGAFPIQAAAIEITNSTVEINDDFVVGPAKTEVFLKPGEKVTKSLSVLNRTDREQLFTVEVEDFTGSKDPNQVVVLLGNDRGPYSLRDYIEPEVNSFKLKSGQRAVMDVVISLPQDAEPGGHYGSVLVSSEPSRSENENEFDNTTKTVSRIGVLYFVRIAGKVKEDARLVDFRLEGEKSFYEKGPFNFEVLFENSSSVHLTPSGTIKVKNMIGRTVKELKVDPFFSLPDSLRAAKIAWDGGFAFGRYTAEVNLARGYQESPDQTDTMSVSFWVLPWKIVVGLIIVIVIAFFILRKLLRSFEIKRKK